MSRANKRNRWQACRIKKVHHDFWSAMQHCISLQKIEPFANIHIYRCDYCEGMHITRGSSWNSLQKIRKGLNSNLRLMSNIKWWWKAPPEVIEYRVSLEMDLLRRIYGLRPMSYPKE